MNLIDYFDKQKVVISTSELADLRGQMNAVHNVMGTIEFDLKGNILNVNKIFADLTGYSVSEIIGKHHSIFVEDSYRLSPEYSDFWDSFSRGLFKSGQFKRIGRNGKELWLQASYNPIFDLEGMPFKVVKYATEITKEKLEKANFEGQINAISKVMGVIEFDLEGNILNVNDNFAKVTGYSTSEIVGRHHSMFVEQDYRNSPEYRAFWTRLSQGIADKGQYKRIGKSGNSIWLEASYNPIFDLNGKPYKVVKYATDITSAKAKSADDEGQIKAINKVMGVIEFDLKGKIISVNDNFASVTGYIPSEIVGNHHSMFIEPTYRSTYEYKNFWEKLARGEADAGQYKRIGAGGKEIWLQASYNPIFDANGTPYKVVKYATEITEQKLKNADYEGQIEAISKVSGVIEFDLKGNIINVNDNFASVTGYSSKEIIGNHHSMFVEPSFKSSNEYRLFWDKLGKGEADAGQYKRIGKGGKEIWLQASYNPIFDMSGRPFKVVKYATDITEQVNAKQNLEEAVSQTQLVVSAAKDGDLTQRIPLEGKAGLISSLCSGINLLIDNMSVMIATIKNASEAINTAAGEISAGNNDLSQRTEEQASSLEETASSMEELASTVKQNAENAKHATGLVNAACSVAEKGGKVVDEVVSTMSEISHSSNKIEEIISVIDGIAFQTNILALNAAVEAARAGEQGRGFAVVAGEVRNLAQRSAAAAKEIKELISNSVARVDGGMKLVEEAGSTMIEIVSSVKRVNDIMNEISAASTEQSDGIDQVNNAVSQMDEVTQQNAALVEESAAAAMSLLEQSNQLMEKVGLFKVSEELLKEQQQSLPKKAEKLATSVNMARSTKPASKPVKKETSPTRAKRTGTDDEWAEF